MVAPDAHAVLILDKAGWHLSGALVVPGQHHPPAAAAALARAQPGRERLAVPARQLALEPRLQRLRRHRRPLLRCLERPHRPAMAHQIHRPPNLGGTRHRIAPGQRGDTMRHPWQEELAVIRAIEAERGDQGGHGRWLLYAIPDGLHRQYPGSGGRRFRMVRAFATQGNHLMKLTDTQLVILTAACQRPNRLVLPLPERLKGGAAQKVVDALFTKGLVEEVEAGCDAPVWRQTGDGYRVTLVATDAALESLGMEAASGATAASTGAPAFGESLGPAEAPQPPASHPAALRGKARDDTKQACVGATRYASKIRTSVHVIECELVSGLKSRLFKCRRPVLWCADQIRISAASSSSRLLPGFSAPDLIDHLPVRFLSSSHLRCAGCRFGAVVDYAAATCVGPL